MKRHAWSFALFLLASSAALAQTKSPVEGVWKVTEVVVQQGHENDWLSGETSAEKTTTITNPEPGLIIFTKNHYSQLVVRGNKPRAAVPPEPERRGTTVIVDVFRAIAPLANLAARWMPGLFPEKTG